MIVTASPSSAFGTARDLSSRQTPQFRFGKTGHGAGLSLCPLVTQSRHRGSMLRGLDLADSARTYSWGCDRRNRLVSIGGLFSHPRCTGPVGIFPRLDVIARQRHSVHAPRQLQLKYDKSVLAECGFGTGKIKIPHPAEIFPNRPLTAFQLACRRCRQAASVGG
jgi:hypothetical protein